MANLRGGNIEEMHRLAKMFTANAAKLNGIINDLNGRTASSDAIWTGPAADRFRSEWSEARAAFERMRQALDEAGTAVTKSAQNIEAATR
ncbi:WXG100 family type VII secretion target [Micromonospora sp. NPDC049460]|uniref:WXG100 family type VII secretion target n=1 Tax=Micromonospora sp. NPDC049460 TaxID=3364272 RepID=UPI0037A2310D